MGLLETEINELREMQAAIIDGKMKQEEVSCRLALYSQTEKRAKMMLSGYAMIAKYGKKIEKNIEGSNLMGGGSAVNTNSEDDEVRCPGTDINISRGACLDYSGGSHQFDECEGCHHFGTTRTKLLGENK